MCEQLLNRNRYNIILEYCQKNKDKPWREWLTLEKIISKESSQGIVGVFYAKNIGKIGFKCSKYIDNLIKHEEKILKGLQKINIYNFFRIYTTIECDVNPEMKKDNLFSEETDSTKIKQTVILFEYIETKNSFLDYIKCKEVPEKHLYSIIKQTLLSLIILQYRKFTHYDLHSDNILIKKCNNDTVFLYNISKDNQICIPSYGIYPVIIDYGFSYILDIEKTLYCNNLEQTEKGFTPFMYDSIVDFKLFLVSSSRQILSYKKTETSKNFRKVVKNIFKPLNINWKTGWNKYEKTSISEKIYNTLNSDIILKSEVFSEDIFTVLELFKGMICLPFSKQNCNIDINRPLSVIINEWTKIEKIVKNNKIRLYILKIIINSAILNKEKYLLTNTRKEAISNFKSVIFENVNLVIKFCTFNNVHFEKLLCSLILFSIKIEENIYLYSKKENKVKSEHIRKMEFNNPELIYSYLEANTDCPYTYNDNTKIIIVDYETNSTKLFIPDKETIEKVNIIHYLARGTYLWDIYKNNQGDIITESFGSEEQGG